MPKSITLYLRKQPVLTYFNQLGELVVVIIDDCSTKTLKVVTSKIMNIPKRFISIKGTVAISDEYSRQLEFNLGHIDNNTK